MKTPRTDLQANTYDFETTALVKATGFRSTTPAGGSAARNIPRPRN
jgi:hypothetical protein